MESLIVLQSFSTLEQFFVGVFSFTSWISSDGLSVTQIDCFSFCCPVNAIKSVFSVLQSRDMIFTSRAVSSYDKCTRQCEERTVEIFTLDGVWIR